MAAAKASDTQPRHAAGTKLASSGDLSRKLAQSRCNFPDFEPLPFSVTNGIGGFGSTSLTKIVFLALS